MWYDLYWLGHNALVGNVPSEVGKLKKLKKFSAAANNLDGELPSTLGDLDELEN